MISNEVDEQFEDEGMIFGVDPEVRAVMVLAPGFQNLKTVLNNEDVFPILPLTMVRHSLCIDWR